MIIKKAMKIKKVIKHQREGKSDKVPEHENKNENENEENRTNLC